MIVTVNNNTRDIHNSSAGPVIPLVSYKMKLSGYDIFLIVIFVVIFVVGLISNILVIRYYGFYNKQKLRYHIYLIHLAVTDLICSIVSPVVDVYDALTGASLHWDTALVIGTSVSPIAVTVSAWIIVSIAYERYRGIVTPLKARWTKFRIHVMVIVIWLASIVTLIPHILFMASVIEFKHRLALYMSILVLVLQSVLPVAFIAFAVTNILQTLSKRFDNSSFAHSTVSAVTSNHNIDNKWEQHGNSVVRRTNIRNRKQEKSILMLIVTFAIFIVCTLPHNIHYIIMLSVNGNWYYLGPSFDALVTANSIMNCFIYAGMDIAFRRYCFSLFKHYINKRQTYDVTGTTF